MPRVAAPAARRIVDEVSAAEEAVKLAKDQFGKNPTGANLTAWENAKNKVTRLKRRRGDHLSNRTADEEFHGHGDFSQEGC